MTFYITTAIDYVNASPHLGHAYEKICADVIARWERLEGKKAFFLTGTDENAQKVERAAKEKGEPPQEFADKNAQLFRDLAQALNISFDGFIRTTEQRHKDTSQNIFQKIFDNGDIYKSTYKGLYCVGCEAFYTEKDLVKGNCPEHETRPEAIEEENYFFKLSTYHQKILNHIKNNPDFIKPTSRRNEILRRLEEPLKDLSVSRNKKGWGIRVPFDQEHTIYVWFEALLNYVSALDYPDGEIFKTFWPADIHLIGTGISWFHTVIWPAMLLSAGIELPKTVYVHGYINLKGKKMSKSAGHVVDPFDITKKYGADQLRYFLIRDIPFGEDGDFSEEALIERINGELVSDLGNLLNRVLTLCGKHDGPFEGTPFLDKQLHFEKIQKHMDNLELHHTLDEIFHFVRAANKYINETEPWKLQGKELGNVLYNLLESLRITAILLSPFIPGAAEKINSQIGIKKQGTFQDLAFRPFTGKPEKGKLLFQKIVS